MRSPGRTVSGRRSPGEKPDTVRVREVDSLAELAEVGSVLGGVVLQGLDLARASFDLDAVDVTGATFLGCRLGDRQGEAGLVARGATVLPPFRGLPYDPFRTTLYSPEELNGPPLDGGAGQLDLEIHRHYERRGGHLPDVLEALAQRLHDHSIDDALGDLLGESPEERVESRVVGVMGGHSVGRHEPEYALAAEVGYLLARRGFYVATGGGPGIMEAANLGAYLGAEQPEALEGAVATLAEHPAPEDERGYAEAGREVLRRHPRGRGSLAVPTWFYGHEPSNLFGRHIAKFFSNSLREDGLLALALHGVVFAPGSAGTVQEVFMDAAQNHYGNFGYRSPMVFLGTERWRRPGASVFDVLRAEAGRYADLLGIFDDPGDVVDFIAAHPPRAPSAGET